MNVCLFLSIHFDGIVVYVLMRLLTCLLLVSITVYAFTRCSLSLSLSMQQTVSSQH